MEMTEAQALTQDSATEIELEANANQTHLTRTAQLST